MTSASKLFHTRRIQFGRRSNTVDDTDSDSYRRTTTNRRHHQLNGRKDRQDHGGCNPPTRRIHRNRLSSSEHDVVQPEPPSGSIINSDDFRSIRRWGSTVNDRLPGVVLLARERLVERLRGVHISENSRPSSSNIHQDESRFIETSNNLVEVMAPTGLAENAINPLSITVFKNIEEEKEGSSRECSICLEGFEEGDELIKLACMHSFHSGCLFPWIEVCGACPNCRKTLQVVTSNANKPVSSSFWESV